MDRFPYLRDEKRRSLAALGMTTEAEGAFETVEGKTLWQWVDLSWRRSWPAVV
jgi:hypothetical protein